MSEKHTREFIDMDAEIKGYSDTGGTPPETGRLLEGTQQSIYFHKAYMREKAIDSEEKEEADSETKEGN
jgi:hypothetical protein